MMQSSSDDTSLGLGEDGVTEVWVIRHGQTSWNAEHRLQGHLDIDLDDTGLEQAKSVGNRVIDSGLTFSALYSSDLIRAQNTAKPISEGLNLEIRTDPRLREAHLGVLQGKTVNDIRRECPEVMKNSRDDPCYCIPGGESSVDKFIRTISALRDIAARHLGHRVIVVTHGGVLRDFYKYVTCTSLHVRELVSKGNTSVSILAARASVHSSIDAPPILPLDASQVPEPCVLPVEDSTTIGGNEGNEEEEMWWGPSFHEANGVRLGWEVRLWGCVDHLDTPPLTM